MEIVYCEKCGTRIPDIDFDRGAVQVGDGAYCAQCAPSAPAGAPPPRPKSAVRKRTPSGAKRYPKTGDTGRMRAAASKKDTGRMRASKGRPPTGQMARAHVSESGRRRRVEQRPASGGGRGSDGGGGGRVVVVAVVLAAVAFGLTAAAIFFTRGGDSRKAPKPDKSREALPSHAPDDSTPKPENTKPKMRRGGLLAMEEIDPPEPIPTPKGAGPLANRIDGEMPSWMRLNDSSLSRWQRLAKKGENWLVKREGPAPKVFIEVPKVSSPDLDGRLSDDVWKHAAKVTGFVKGEGNKDDVNPPALQETTVYLFYDDAHLFVGIKAEDSDIAGLKREGTATGRRLWRDDGVEIFLDFDRDYDDYRQLMINVDGVKAEGAGRQGAADTPGLRVKTSVHDDRWEMEIAIPFSAEGARPAKPGIIWGVNFIRNGYVGEDYYSSSWAHLKSGNNHTPFEWGYLIFK